MTDVRIQSALRERVSRDLTSPQSLECALGRLDSAFWYPIDDDLSPSGRAAHCPALPVEQLGDPTFAADLGLSFNYFAGAMANGIASVDLVVALGRAGLLGFFGAAGLSVPRIEQDLERLSTDLRGQAFGCNLIHSPQEPRHEDAVVDLLIKRRLRLVEASAYLDLSPALVRYRLTGIHVDAKGQIVTPNRVIAKVSRVEVATKFMSPPPAALVRPLVATGLLTAQQAELAQHVSVAQDITAEADSAGHTDNRPPLALVPTLIALRDRLQAKYEYDRPLRVGAAGGIATPAAVAAAFTLGAAYVVTGSVNQACRESGSSDPVREMLAQAEQADTCMAPAADMFEMGVKVQVLKRGTLFPMRASRLYDLYRRYDSLDALPAQERTHLERVIFHAPLTRIWEQTRDFFQERDPRHNALAERDPKHKMALVFRWYLGQSSRWANTGEPNRKADYQIWCGPAMGAFNEWTRGSFLERPAERRVATVAFNLLYGAAVHLRAQALRLQGARLPTGVPAVRPLPWTELKSRLQLPVGG